MQRFCVAMKLPRQSVKDNTSMMQNTYNNKTSVVTPSTAQSFSSMSTFFCNVEEKAAAGRIHCVEEEALQQSSSS